ncbi:hypothetical protein PB2503_06577 [Parvularcula bermudensis HTCC2503]|uniref:Uncharacterized protein n=1 Tax=Parvularcula bermudensis (strain ATCC BAA-594 / HTCC2503 / KCTC 12087) TaxID=314260 RepID=E0TI42_PARBH|nr:YihY/virulence factor BrkB family protein [Parvularcula bermudensis]ADM09381.1 hypothetical protein PB2503_06577 [Parvularcula bermudensis HTCC2503]
MNDRQPHEGAFRAKGPLHLPLKRWRKAVFSLLGRIGQDNLSLVAAGVAFFAFLSVFPALVALVGLVGLIADPVDIVDGIAVLAPVLPPNALDLIQTELSRIAEGRGEGLLVTTLFSLSIALWSANRGVKNFAFALTIVHDETTSRNIVVINVISLALTAIMLFGAIAALSVVAIIPIGLQFLGLPNGAERLISIAQWIFLFVLIVALATVVLKWAPDRRAPTWRWSWPGALLGTILWVGTSLLFSYYVRHVNNFSATYGSLATVTVVMLWSYLSAFVFLIGGELNAALERQALGDSTVGGVQRPGKRDAVPADTIPPS